MSIVDFLRLHYLPFFLSLPYNQKPIKMAKKVKVTECCVITTDEKGQRSLVGKAKEALTTLSKNKIDVTIFLETTPKEDAEKFLNENNVPYKELKNADDYKDGEKPKFDAVVVGENNIVVLGSDWTWALDSIVDKLYNGDEKPAHKSEQEKMDDKFKDYKHWADEANAAKKKRQASDVSSSN